MTRLLNPQEVLTVPINDWEVYDIHGGSPEDAVTVREWDAEDAAKSAAEKMDLLAGEWQGKRVVMVRQKTAGKEWKKYVVEAECTVSYSASEADE